MIKSYQERQNESGIKYVCQTTKDVERDSKDKFSGDVKHNNNNNNV